MKTTSKKFNYSEPEGYFPKSVRKAAKIGEYDKKAETKKADTKKKVK